MNNFSSNPIVVRKDGDMLGIIDLDFDLELKDFILEIKNDRGEVLFNQQVFEDTFITLDASNEIIHLSYIDPQSKSSFYNSTINLYEKFNLSQSVKGGEILNLGKKENAYQTIVQRVKEEMDNPKGSQKEVEHHTFMLNQATMSEDARLYVTNKIRQVLTRFDSLNEEEIEKYTTKVYSDFYGMGILQEIDDDPDVGEIMVNGFVYPYFHCDIYYVKNGEKLPFNKTFKDLDELFNVFSRSIAFSKKELNNLENAIVEATRSNRDRVNIVIPDASESYVMNIRKFNNFVPNLEMMYEYGTVDNFIDELMKIVVQGKANIGIGGPMGTGKTTFINFLLSYTPKIERKVVIASVSETDVERVLKGHDVIIFNVNEIKGFTFDKLLRTSLRTTADRVIIPESRGEEFRQVYEANLKTKGNMFTAHALDDYSFLDMCVDMYANGRSMNVDSLRNKICKALDIVIVMRKVGNGIRIKSISEVVVDDKQHFERMNLLYYWESDPEDSTKGEYRRTENRLTDAIKTRMNEYGVPMSSMKDL